MTTVMTEAMVALEGVVRTFGHGDGEVRALDGVTLALEPGSFTAIMGPAGSGKSTLLRLAAGLDRPTAGRIVLRGRALGERSLARLQRERLGFVFQSFDLLSALTAEQNVALPARLAGGGCRRPSSARRSSRSVSATARAPAGAAVGRRAAARSDRPRARGGSRGGVRREPTGALDSGSGGGVVALLRATVDAGGRTLVMVTHDPSAAAWADRVVFMADGRLAGELEAPTAEDVAERLTELGA